MKDEIKVSIRMTRDEYAEYRRLAKAMAWKSFSAFAIVAIFEKAERARESIARADAASPPKARAAAKGAA